MAKVDVVEVSISSERGMSDIEEEAMEASITE
jgi:hypothetical protein